MSAGAMDEVFAAVSACERHNHEPETINITWALAHELAKEVLLPPPIVGEESFKKSAEEYKRYMDSMRDGTAKLLDIPVKVHPTQPRIWIHDDEWPFFERLPS